MMMYLLYPDVKLIITFLLNLNDVVRLPRVVADENSEMEAPNSQANESNGDMCNQ